MMNNNKDPGIPSSALSERNTNILQDCLGPKKAHDHAQTTARVLSTLGREKLCEWIESMFKLGIHNARQLIDNLDLLPSIVDIHSDMIPRGEVLQHAEEINNTGISSASGATGFVSTPRELAQSLLTSLHATSPIDFDGTISHTGTNHPLYDSHVSDVLPDTGMVPADKRVPCTRCGKTFKMTKMKRFYYTHLRMQHEISNDAAKVETENEYNKAIQKVFPITINSGHNQSRYFEVPGLVFSMEQPQHITSQRSTLESADQQFDAAASGRSSPGTGGLHVLPSTRTYSGSGGTQIISALSPPQLCGGPTFNGYPPVANRLPTGLDSSNSPYFGINSSHVSNAAQQNMWPYETRQPGFFSRMPKTDNTVDVGYPSSFAESGASDSEHATSSFRTSVHDR